MTIPTTDAATAGALDVRPYSFGQSSHLTAEKVALYNEAAAQVAGDISRTLADSLTGFTVEPGALIEVEAGDEIVEGIESFDTASVRNGRALCAGVVTELGLALTLVTAMLGGAAIPAGDPRKLTVIEQRVLDLLGQVFVDTARETLLINDELNVDRSRDGAFTAADEEETAARVGFSFSMKGPGGGGRLILAFDLATIQEFSDAIDSRLSGRRTAAPVVADPQAAAALQAVPIPFSVGLGSVSLTAKQLVELEIGDVIQTSLPVASDLVASVGEIDLFGVRTDKPSPHTSHQPAAQPGRSLRQGRSHHDHAGRTQQSR